MLTSNVPSDLDLHSHMHLGNSLDNNQSIQFLHNNLQDIPAWKKACRSSGWLWNWDVRAQDNDSSRAPYKQRCCYRSVCTVGRTVRSCPPCNKDETLPWDPQEGKVGDMEAGKHHKDVYSSSRGSVVDQRHPEESEEGADAASLVVRLP